MDDLVRTQIAISVMRYMSIVIVRMRCFCLLLYFSLKNQYKHHQRQQEYHRKTDLTLGIHD
jgi:hypothetical protein